MEWNGEERGQVSLGCKESQRWNGPNKVTGRVSKRKAASQMPMGVQDVPLTSSWLWPFPLGVQGVCVWGGSVLPCSLSLFVHRMPLEQDQVSVCETWVPLGGHVWPGHFWASMFLLLPRHRLASWGEGFGDRAHLQRVRAWNIGAGEMLPCHTEVCLFTPPTPAFSDRSDYPELLPSEAFSPSRAESNLPLQPRPGSDTHGHPHSTEPPSTRCSLPVLGAASRTLF